MAKCYTGLKYSLLCLGLAFSISSSLHAEEFIPKKHAQGGPQQGGPQGGGGQRHAEGGQGMMSHQAGGGREMRGHEVGRMGQGPMGDHDRGMRQHGEPGGHPHEFSHHEFRDFDARERHLWGQGRWNHTCFDGRCGYWWLAAGVWYFYDAPVYPYPQEISTVVYTTTPVVTTTTTTTVVQKTEPVYKASAAAKTRYYCDNPPGYFPEVQSCNGTFRTVAP